MLLLGQYTIDEVKSHELIPFAPVMPDDIWKIDMVRELIEVKENQALEITFNKFAFLKTLVH